MVPSFLRPQKSSIVPFRRCHLFFLLVGLSCFGFGNENGTPPNRNVFDRLEFESLLQSTDSNIRVDVITRLQYMRLTEDEMANVLPHLISILDDPHPAVREASLFAIGGVRHRTIESNESMESPEFIAAIRKILTADPEAKVRKAAAAFLFQFRWPENRNLFFLAIEDAEVRDEADRLYGNYGGIVDSDHGDDEENRAFLIKRIDHPSAFVSYWASRVILTTIRNSSIHLHAWQAPRIQEIGENWRKDTDSLVERLDDVAPKAGVHLAAAVMLIDNKCPEAKEYLLAHLDTIEEEYGNSSLDLAWVFPLLGKDSLRFLGSVYRFLNWGGEWAEPNFHAKSLLVRWGKPVVPTLSRWLTLLHWTPSSAKYSKPEISILEVLRRLGPDAKAAEPVVRCLTKSDDERIRHAAEEALVAIISKDRFFSATVFAFWLFFFAFCSGIVFKVIVGIRRRFNPNDSDVVLQEVSKGKSGPFIARIAFPLICFGAIGLICNSQGFLVSHQYIFALCIGTTIFYWYRKPRRTRNLPRV